MNTKSYRAQYGDPSLYINNGLNIQHNPKITSHIEIQSIRRCCGMLLLNLDRVTWDIIIRELTDETRAIVCCTIKSAVSIACCRVMVN